MGFDEYMAATEKKKDEPKSSFDAYVDKSAPVITENPTHKEDFGQMLQGGLTATVDAGANMVEGAARGMQNIDNAVKQSPLAQVLPHAAPQLVPPGNDQPTDLVSPVHQAYQQQIEQGQKEHPMVSAAAQGAGELLPTIPAWEMGAGAMGGALKMGAPTAAKAIEASGPLGQALVAAGQQSPAVLRVLSQVAQQGAGGFLSGMQEEAAKEMGKPNGKPNMLKILTAGAESMAAGATMGGVAGILGEGITKLKLKHAEHAQKAQQKLEQAALDHHLEMQRQYNEQGYPETIEEKQQSAEAQKQAAIDDEKNKAEARVNAAAEQAKYYREQAKSWEKRYDGANDELRKRNYGTPEERLRLRASQDIDHIKQTREEARNRADYFNQLHMEAAARHTAELKKWEGRPSDVGEASGRNAVQDRSAAAAQRQPILSVSSKVLPTEADRAAIADAERQALRFTGNVPPSTYKGGIIHDGKKPRAPKAVESPDAPSSSESPPAENNAQTVHDLQKGRGNRGRAYAQEHSGEPLNEGMGIPGHPDYPDWDNAESPAERAHREAGEAADAEFLAENPQAAQALHDSGIVMGSSFEGSAIMGAVKLFKTLPKSERTYDGFMHICGVQKFTDIATQYEPELMSEWTKAGKSITELHGGITKQFKDAAGKLAFAQMGVEKAEADIMRKGLRGKLTPEESAALTPEVRESLKKSREAIKEYLDKTKNIGEWLDANTGDGRIESNSGLGRMAKTLRLQRQDLNAVVNGEKGNAENLVQDTGKVLMTVMFAGKGANAVIHAAEKGVALAAKENPYRLSAAIVNSYKPGVYKDFADAFMAPAQGPITEAFQDAGVQAKTIIGKALTGQGIECSPQRVAAILGLNKAAKNLGYANGEALAGDILKARKGQGPLAMNSPKLVEAMSQIQGYVSDVTGANVAGLKDANIFQRNKNLAFVNLFATMPSVQSRNGHLLVKAALSGDPKALTALGAYAFGQYVVAGDKGALPKDAEELLRHTAGEPNYYHFMDTVHAGRAMMHIDELPTIPHLQPSVSPLIGQGGASLLDIVRKTGQAAVGAKNPETQVKAVFNTLGGLAGGQIAGFGTGVISNYAQAARDGARGYKTLNVYKHLGLGGEQMQARIPVETSVVKALSEAYFGTHDKTEQELEYNAAKSMDLRQWCKQNAPDKDFINEAMRDEKDIDAVSAQHELDQEKNETIKDLQDMGYKDGSAEITKIKEHYTKMSAAGGKQLEIFKARAQYWQERADEIQKLKKAPEPVSSPRGNA